MSDNATVLAIAIPRIKADEGFRSQAYPDPLSHGEPWTIGYGRADGDVRPGETTSEPDASAWLGARCGEICDELDTALPWWRSLDPARGAVLVNMAYNLGIAGLLAFHNTLTHIERGDYALASAGMLASKWAAQVKGRATRLAAMMKTGLP